MNFVGRTQELAALERFHARNSAGLFILYGRRRVGKTELINQWLRGRQSDRVLFWTAPTFTPPLQLREFSQALLELDPDFARSVPGYAFQDWDAALEFLARTAEKHPTPLIAVIDEFTNVVRKDALVTSVFQRQWDRRLSRIPNLRLILTGSFRLPTRAARPSTTAVAPAAGEVLQMSKARR